MTMVVFCLLRSLSASCLIAGIVSALPNAVQNPAVVETIYQFPNGTWVENVAVRRNGRLLVTLLTEPSLYMLNPEKTNAIPSLVHNFPDATALFGVAEMQADVFAVAAGNYSLQSGNIQGSYSIWKVDFSSWSDSQDAEISLIARLPEVQFINGICSLPQHPEILLLADIEAGQVLRLDTDTGKLDVAVPSTNELVESNAENGTPGVDGIHVMGNTLYVANAGSGLFGRIHINDNGTWDPTMGSSIITHAANGTNFDDFALDGDGSAYLVTSSGNTIIYVTADGQQRLVAGDPHSTEIAEPTSAALSRGRMGHKTLYVVTGGGWLAPINGNEIVGGQVLAIRL